MKLNIKKWEVYKKMVITDFNQMSLDELKAINKVLCMEYVINDGRIIKTIDGRRNKNEQN